MSTKDNINILENSKKEISAGYKVPDSYFDTLEEKILSKTREEVKPETKIRPIQKWLTLGLSIAAAIIIGYMVFPSANNLSLDTLYEHDLEQFAYYGDEEWLVEEMLPISEDEISIDQDDINALIDDGVTVDEILDVYESELLIEDMNIKK